MTTHVDKSVAALVAADPARTAVPQDPAERERVLRAITSTTPGRLAPRQVRVRSRRPPRRVGLAVALLVLASAGGVTAATGGLPVGDNSIVKSIPEAKREIRGASAQIPVAPGQRDPGVGSLEGSYAQGAASGQLLFRRMCTWDKSLLEAIAAGDAATIASTKAELAKPRWYTYFAPGSDDAVRRMHATAGPGNTTTLQQHYDANCKDVTG